MRERAVILLYTETYLVLVKEPSCYPLPVPPHSPCFPRQASRFQLAAPSDWGQHGRDCNPAQGGCSLSLTLFISLFISLFITLYRNGANQPPSEDTGFGDFSCFPPLPSSSPHFPFLLWASTGVWGQDLPLLRLVERTNIRGEVEVKKLCTATQGMARANNPEFILL